jgi:ABC-type lipoprotein release transport system permease subunit
MVIVGSIVISAAVSIISARRKSKIKN